MYKHNDQRSQIIRNLDNPAAHIFLCHPDDPEECDGGATCFAHSERLKLYDQAFEEEEEEEEEKIDG